jgi:hypothetical protein
MPVYGSSPFPSEIFSFTSQRGPQGPRGPRGLTGPQGITGYGPTGPTGYGITYLNFIDSVVNTIYTDGYVESSNPVNLSIGNYYLELTGATSGRFSPLKSTELVSNLTETVLGNAITFPVVRRLNFKNLKTNSSPFVTISYVYPPDRNDESSLQQPGQTIQIDYSVFNLSASILGGGSTNTLVINNPGDIQSGLTGTTYNPSLNSAGFGILNAAEQLAVIHKARFGSGTVNVWKIDPTQASVFYLADFSSLTSASSNYISGNHICIKKDVTTDSTKGFTIIFPKEFYCSNSFNKLFYSTYSNDSDVIDTNFDVRFFKTKFEPNVIWQSDSFFCPSEQLYDVVNFISLGSRYVGIPAHYKNRTNTEATIQAIPAFSCDSEYRSLVYQSTFNPRYGVCCKTDCSCEMTNDYQCSGYFYEGLTCGGATGICSNLGACCLYSTETNISIPCQELTFCNCYTIANESNLSYNWNPFTTIKKSCADFNCSNSKNNIGACCDGNGSCTEIPESECASIKGYYQGNGVNCTTSDNLNVCVSGYGACCDSGVTCTAGISGQYCLSQFKTFFGDGTTCGDFTCSAADIPCYSILENQLLSPGMEYDGGIVVGIFDPDRSNCFGPAIFDGNTNTFSVLAGTTLVSSSEYLSNYDYSGYGFDPASTCDSSGDSYIILLSPHPVNIDDAKELVDGNLNTSKFIWSNGSNAWGPLLDISSNVVSEFDINNLSYKEGYIYDSSNETSSKLSLYNNTFLSCSSARFDTDTITHLENKPLQSMTGLWTRNYGLYNTVRLVGGEYFYYNIGSSQSGATMANYTPVSSALTAARALSIYNIEKAPTTIKTSNWYIPSIDELAFLASKCLNTSDFNLNSRLLELGYTPLYDWHWSSTGALNTDKNEGILTPSGVTFGSEAWAIKFDADGIGENMLASRQNRTNEYYVRPIKLLRCDKRYANTGDGNFKVWYVPVLSEFIIDNS